MNQFKVDEPVNLYLNTNFLLQGPKGEMLIYITLDTLVGTYYF